MELKNAKTLYSKRTVFIEVTGGWNSSLFNLWQFHSSDI
jgi:hypothetical protein